jgi:hypothetical protein
VPLMTEEGRLNPLHRLQPNHLVVPQALGEAGVLLHPCIGRRGAGRSQPVSMLAMMGSLVKAYRILGKMWKFFLQGRRRLLIAGL